MRALPPTLALLLAGSGLAMQAPEPGGERVRGITISTHGGGRDWGTEVMEPTLREIRRTGATWVAIHPYARITRNGTVRWSPIDAGSPPAHLAHPIAEAHRQGLKILIKPHLAYWGTPFRWRGEIEFDDDGDWQRFWEGYSSWILALAAACKDADGFCVGTELDRTLRFDKEWRELIGGVRRRAGFPITYAANWTDYEQVPFWDACDAIGIQGYFPVADKVRAGEAELRAGWQRLLARLAAFGERHDRNVVFTELGYNRSFSAAVRPWDYHTDGPEAEPFQALCLRVALESIAAQPRVVGAFLWKWFPHPRPVGRNFQLATPLLRATIAGAWR